MTRAWLGRAVGLLGAFLLLYTFLPVDRDRPDRVLVVSAAVYALYAARAAAGRGSRPRGEAEREWDGVGAADELDVRLSRLESALRDASRSHGRFERSVRRTLARLAHDRIRLHHGFDPAADPRRARHLMGDDLWQMLSVPGDPESAAPGPHPAHVEALVRQIELL